MTTTIEDNTTVSIVCPSIIELSVIVNHVDCPICGSTFGNQSQFRMHDLKVHKQEKLIKNFKKNNRYHCPVESCMYSITKQRHFKLYKYLKQHYLKVHAEKQFACDRCTKRFSTVAAKDAHFKICGTDFVCECQKAYNTYEALLTHAKRKSHKINCANRNNRRKFKTIDQQEKLLTKLVYIRPKSICNVAIQTEKATEELKNLTNKTFKKHVCQQTQTNNNFETKEIKVSTETQTTEAATEFNATDEIEKHEKILVEKKSLIIDDVQLSECLPSLSPLSHKHDISLQEIWAEPVKNIFTFTSSTQTSPEKNTYESDQDKNSQGSIYHSLFRSDPMLTEKIYTEKFNSTETQTEEEYCRSIFESDSLNSNNETQTSGNFTETIEPLIYNDTYTQTCDEIFSSVLSDIQTQTPWNYLDEVSTVADSGTKISKCSNCSDSVAIHTETQTDDLLYIFENLR